MPEEITLEKVMEAFTEFKSELKNKTPDLAKIEKIEKTLDDWETIKQKHLTDLKNSENAQKEFKERIDGLEKEIALNSNGGVKKDYRESKEYQALESYAKLSGSVITAETKASLRTDVDQSGGFLLSVELDSRLLRKVVDISNVRPFARVRTTTTKTLEVVIEDQIPTAQYEGELEENVKDISVYSNESITSFALTLTIPVSQDALMNSTFPLETEIIRLAARAFARAEGLNFVRGSSFKRPSGFITDKRVIAAGRTSANAGTLDWDDTIDLTGDIKDPYNPIYLLNRRTLAFLRKIKGGDGHPIWMPGMVAEVPNQINGFAYALMNDMPDIAAGATPLAFADLMEGYLITDRTGTTMVRDDITQVRKRQVKFTMTRWNTGQVVLPEAIKILTIKT